MNINRRAFLGGASALAASIVLPLPAVASVPTIYGDGIHDDTDGLQAMLDGKPFASKSEAKVMRAGDTVYLEGGEYRISRMLHINSQVNMRNVNIVATRPLDYAIRIPKGRLA